MDATEEALFEELNMIRSLIQAENSQDSSQIQQAQEKILRHSQSNLTHSTVMGDDSRSSVDLTPQKESKATGLSRKKTSQTPVSKLLRHSKQLHPVIVNENTSVKEVAKLLSSKRQSAALVLRMTESGTEKLCGICSEVDICRRMVGSAMSADEPVSKIMTANPKFVDPDEDFSVVLELMVKHRFRHLPVVLEQKPESDSDSTRENAPPSQSLPGDDPSSSRKRSNPAGICGLIDITQCLYDAIHKIERLQENQAEFFLAVQRAQESTASVGDGLLGLESSSELAQRTLQALMDSISPSVGAVVQRKSLLKLDVKATVLDAALAMKEARMTAVLVFEGLGTQSLPYSHKLHELEEHEKFVGILTSKDVMSRVVAKGLDPAHSMVGEFMTPNPDTVRRDSSVLDALHIMQSERFLHLPVVDVEDSIPALQNESYEATQAHEFRTSSTSPGGRVRVCGILSVLDCAVHTFSKSTGTAAKVLSSSDIGKPPAGSSRHKSSVSSQQSAQLYHPTPVHGRPQDFSSSGSSRISTDSVAIAPMKGTYSHQHWRDPDSISAFSEVRSARKLSEDLEEHGSVQSQQAAEDLICSVGPPASISSARKSTRDRSMSSSTGRARNIVLKVTDGSNGKIYRISAGTISCFDDLLAQLERCTGNDRKELNLVYLDEDNDEVQLASESAFEEARDLADQQSWKKIDVTILSPESERRRMHPSPRRFQRSTANIDPLVLVGCCIASLAVTVALGIALFSSRSKSSSSYSRRYR